MCAVDTPPGKNISIHALREEGDPASVAFAVAVSLFLSTPSARRATPDDLKPIHKLSNFYPRPPRGGRQATTRRCPTTAQFLSTPSARRATFDDVDTHCDECISIHALREEGDNKRLERHIRASKFLSTPSARRATARTSGSAMKKAFLSTPSARRATLSAGTRANVEQDFYPRPPRGGRHPVLLNVVRL